MFINKYISRGKAEKFNLQTAFLEITGIPGAVKDIILNIAPKIIFVCLLTLYSRYSKMGLSNGKCRI